MNPQFVKNFATEYNAIIMEQDPSKKNGKYTTPEGEEFYRDGILQMKIRLNGDTETYNEEGRLVWSVDKDGKELPINALKPDAKVEKAREKEEEKPSIDAPKPNTKGEKTKVAETKISDTEIDEKKEKKTAKLARKIIKDAKKILEESEEKIKASEASLLLPKNSGEAVIEQAKAKKALEELTKEHAKMKEDLRLAEESLAAAQKEETVDPSNDKQPFYKNKWLQVGALVALLATDIAGKKIGWWGNDAPKKGITQKEAIKKETNVPYVSPATNMTEEIKKVTDKPPTLTPEEITAKIKAEFEKEKAEMRVLHSNQLAEIKAAKSTPVVAPKPTPKTHEELLADIRERLTKGGQVTADEAMMHNRDLMSRPTVIQVGQTIELGGQTTAERIDDKSAPIRRMKESPAGVNYTYNTPGGVNFNNQPPTQAERAQLNNPYNLSAKTLEEVEEVYERNIEKIFPNDTLKTWRNIKDKGAYEFMSKTESRVQKEYKPLFSYLEQIKKITGLSPRSGTRGVKSERIEEYIGRASQKAAQQGNLDDVKLK